MANSAIATIDSLEKLLILKIYLQFFNTHSKNIDFSLKLTPMYDFNVYLIIVNFSMQLRIKLI